MKCHRLLEVKSSLFLISKLDRPQEERAAHENGSEQSPTGQALKPGEQTIWTFLLMLG